MASIRAQLAASLKPLLSTGWRIIDHQDNLDTFTSPVVMLKQQEIEPAPAAPAGAHIVTLVVTIADPKTDPGPAEDSLDENVDNLIHALDSIDYLNWTKATKVLFQDRYLAYDINLEVISRKE